MLIPGPKQPGNDIDVYLRPLVEELLLLSGDEGVRMWDARGESSPTEVTISTLTGNIFFHLLISVRIETVHALNLPGDVA